MATPSRAKKVLFTALAGLGVTAGAAGIASAATSQQAPTDPPAALQDQNRADTETEDGAESPNYTSSITVPQTPDDGTETDDEAGEASKLAPLAKVTAADAEAAATAAVPGTAGPAELGDENGSIVYEVEVTAADGSKVEVKVDAGNGDVLAQETADAEGADEADEAGETEGANEVDEASEGSNAIAAN